ncbi:MAG: hydantoinase B/oxoprolinase family protein, partial [Dehalococcoidales bacterium]|nr:hydantoinase B/oxoprolinase family protein [Dehalococcoidales bacterium]
MYKVDSVTMQVIRYAMEQIADEMGYSLMRMSRSTIVKEIMDFACAILDRDGNTVAQAQCQPMMLYSLEMTARKMMEMYPEDYFHDGDVIVSNDPYLGGQHIMDVQFFSPVIHDGKLFGFVADIAHQLDMGGSVPGGVAGGLTEIYQEGLRLSLLKLYDRGEEDRQLFTVIANNIRLPERTLGDFKAQAAATFVGVR